VRRLVVLVFALVLPVLVAACGGSSDKTTAPETVVGTVPQGGGTSVEGDAAAGKPVFVDNCGSCHTLADAGTTGTTGPNLDDVQPSAEKVVSQVNAGSAIMPSFKGTLTDQQIADVAAYVSENAGS
jgi:mono/diheme cytochrome c family protein